MTSDTEIRSGEITLLGLIAAIAEAWKWFIIVPIAMALAVYLLLGRVSADYRSSAILRIDDEVALLTSSSVLMATIDKLDMRSDLGSTMDEAKRALSRRVSTTTVAPGVTEVSVTAQSPERAQDTLATIIENFARQIEPRGNQREEIERQIAANIAAVDQMREYARSFSADAQRSEAMAIGSNDAMLGYVALVNEIQTKEDTIVRLQRSLDGLTQMQILQEPTLAEDAVASSSLIFSLLSAVAAALGVLFFVLVGEVVRRAPADPHAAVELQRIRRAFRLL